MWGMIVIGRMWFRMGYASCHQATRDFYKAMLAVRPSCKRSWMA